MLVEDSVRPRCHTAQFVVSKLLCLIPSTRLYCNVKDQFIVTVSSDTTFVQCTGVRYRLPSNDSFGSLCFLYTEYSQPLILILEFQIRSMFNTSLFNSSYSHLLVPSFGSFSIVLSIVGSNQRSRCNDCSDSRGKRRRLCCMFTIQLYYSIHINNS